MKFFFSFLFLLMWVSFFFNFKKKIISLLILEALMIYLIVCYNFFSNIFYLFFFVLMIFSVFMVLDSVFGVSLLICCSRNSSVFHSYFSSL